MTIHYGHSRIILLAVGLAAMALLIGFGTGIALAPAGRSPDIEPVVGAAAPTPTSSYDGDLRHLLFAPPTGVTPERGQGGDDYTMSLQQAATVYGTNGGGEAYLTQLGFQQGASWTWAGPGYSVLILLYQFGSAADAFHWTADSVAAQITAPQTTAQGELSDVDGARYFVQPMPPKGGTTLVYLSRNEIGALVGVRSTGPPDPSVAINVAERQYAQLP